MGSGNRTYAAAYFLTGAEPEPPLRKTLKNSLEEGSSTITSLLLAKLVL